MTPEIHLKTGVDPAGCTTANIRGMVVCAGVFAEFYRRFTITAIADGKHMTGSKHYQGNAFDVRSRDEGPGYEQWSDDEKRMLAQTCRNRLGSDYDVVVEGNHFHVEFDPK